MGMHIFFYRTALTSMLADEIDNVDPTDIIVLNQEVVDVGSGVTCLDVSMRVLGSTRELHVTASACKEIITRTTFCICGQDP